MTPLSESWPSSYPVNAPSQWRPILTHRSFSDVWSGWVQQPMNPAWPIAAITTGYVLTFTLTMAWMRLPMFLANATVANGFFRSLRAVAGGIGLLAQLIWACGAGCVLAGHSASIDLVNGRYGLNFMQGVVWLGIPAALLFVVWWLGRSALGARGEEPDPAVAPRCEGCGYDLTHRPDSGVCPECQKSIMASLDASPRRAGGGWEDGRRHWIRTSCQILWRPRKFYSSLRMHTDLDASSAFARRHFIWIAVAAWAWSLAILPLSQWSSGVPLPTLAELIVIPISFGLFISLVGIVLLGLVGAVPAALWAAGGYLPVPRWTRKLIAYEAPFLWVFGAYNGAIAAGYILLPAAVNNAIWGFLDTLFRVPVKVSLVGFANAALIVVWLYRYRAAGRAVRWSNF